MKIKNYLTSCRLFATALLVTLTAQKLGAQTITGLSVPGATSNSAGTNLNVDFITSSATIAGYKAIDVSMNNTKGEYLVFDDTSASNDWEIVENTVPTSGTWYGLCKSFLINDNNCTGNCTVRFYIRHKGTTLGAFKNKITIALGNSGSSCSYNASGSYTLVVNTEKVAANGIYSWIGTHGSGDSTWGQSDNWMPARTSPSTSDVLVVDLGTKGNVVSSTIDVASVTESISQFRIYNYNNVVLNSITGNAIINVGNGAAGDDFLVDSFGGLITAGTKILYLNIPANNTFQISGKFGMNFGSLVLEGPGKYTFSNDLNLTYGVLYFRGVTRRSFYFNGTNQTINGTGSYWPIDSFSNIEVGRANATTTLTLNRPMVLMSKLTLLPNATLVSNTPSGTSAAQFNSWNPYLQFRSPLKLGAKSRGQLDEMPTGAKITGGCLFEIAGTNIRSYKMFGIPLKNGVNLSQFADNIDLTGTVTGNNKDSFSTGCTYCISSAFNWDEATQSWSPYASGNTANNVPHGKGIMVFFRGPKGFALGIPYYPGTYSSIDFKGEIFYGSKTVNLDYNGSGTSTSLQGFNLVANPYPCAIDFNKISKPTGFKQKFVVYDGRAKTYNIWDSTVSGSLSRSGSAKFVNSTQNNSRNIEAGGAFFVIASGTGESITFNESAKSADVVGLTDQFKATENNLKCNELRIGIKFDNDSVPENDNSLIQLDMNYSGVLKSSDAFDAPKIHGGFLGIGTVSEDGVWMSIDKRNSYEENVYSLPLKVITPENNLYKITMDACESNSMKRTVVLVDKLLNKITPFRNHLEYKFVKSGSDLLIEDRFELVVTNDQEVYTNTKSVDKNKSIVYPNPSNNGMFNLVMFNNQSSVELQLFSVDGKLVKVVKSNNMNDVVPFKVDNKGIYILKVVGPEGVKSHIIQNN